VINTKIDEYEVAYSMRSYFPRIWLKSNKKVVGQLVFRANGSDLPFASMDKDQVQLYYHLEDYANTIDFLRNEKPVYLFYTGSGEGNENGIKMTSD
jgi:hypothetical protein